MSKTLVREILVETGFLISVSEGISVRDHPEFLVETHCFVGKMISQNQLRPIEEKYEITENRWVNPEEIRKLITSDLDPGAAKYLGI